MVLILGVGLLLVVLAVATSTQFSGEAVALEQMRALAGSRSSVRFVLAADNVPVNAIRRQVYSFDSDGLKQYALVVWPNGDKPETGWPVLLFDHGYHPDPPNYGRIKGGSSDRPGDYYRGIPQVYAEAGYLVVVPDYRGHNRSEGAAYTGDVLATHWYSRDVLNAFGALSSLPDVNEERVYLLGHSMGGAVTQVVIASLGERIRAASIWSTSVAGGSLQPLLELRYPDLYQPADLKSSRVPLLIQHAVADQTTAVANSRDLYEIAQRAGAESALYLYDTDAHLFAARHFQQAVERDLNWFERHR